MIVATKGVLTSVNHEVAAAKPFLLALLVICGFAVSTHILVRKRSRSGKLPRRDRQVVGYAIVPSKDFDPTLEHIRRFAAGLLQTRKVTKALLGKHSRQMVRVSFVSDSQGDLVTLINVSRRARSVIERVGYPNVELELVDEVKTLGPGFPTWLDWIPPEPLVIHQDTPSPSPDVASTEPPRAEVTPVDAAEIAWMTLDQEPAQ